MASSEYLDTRIRRRHIPLITQQRRLRHLRSISARNVTGVDPDESALAFTLHRKPELDEFYTSETSDSVNPTWKDFENSFADSVDTASPFVCIKVWNFKEGKQLLIEWVVFFSGLVFLGEQIPKEGKNFKPNSLLFGMGEGYYGCSDCYQYTFGNISEASDKESISSDISSTRKSYTLSTLSRIKTVERAIKQTQFAVQKRRKSINDKLLSSQDIHRLHSQIELLEIKKSVLQTELQTQEKIINSIEMKVASQKNMLLKARREMAEKSEEQKKLIEKCFELSRHYCEFRETLLKTEASLNCRRKALISELKFIYPIVEFPDKNGSSILEVHLPNSEEFSGHDDKMISVALGYVSHVLLMTSQFLNVPLRYSILFYGSQSCIVDHISSELPDKTREFPLYSKGKDKRCFEYGVFLLNKNIAQLRIYSGLTTRDLSATLPNLSSLIEARLSIADSEIPGITPLLITQSSNPKLNLFSNKPSQNGFPSQATDIVSPPPENCLKPSDSEFELLQREMHAMIPTSSSTSNHNGLHPPQLSKESLNALSCSLDKCLNDFKSLENTSVYTNLASRTPFQKNFIRQTSHHSSYPNLSAAHGLEAETFTVDSPMPSTPPKVWTTDSSRTNSEDEPIEERPKFDKQQAMVLNDSIFYIPSEIPIEPNSDLASNMCERIEKVNIEDDFTANISMRAEQLSNNKSSFQMQRLHSSSNENEPHC